jgi:hypothetical protein
MSKENCIAACIPEGLECHQVCMETLTYCLHKGEDYAEASHLQLLLDCSQICLTAVDFMTRGSDIVCRISEIAAYICERTATSCERWADTDETMKRCRDVCRQAGESCRKIMIAA